MPATLEGKVDSAIKLSNSLDEIIEMRDTLVWHEGKLLNELKNNGLYKNVYGMDEHVSNEKSWSAFLREKSIPKSTAEFKIALHNKYIVELGYSIEELRGINTRKLRDAISFIPNGDRAKAEELLSSARTLSVGDFAVLLRGNVDVCWHPKSSLLSKKVEVKECKDCGKRVKEVEEICTEEEKAQH